MAHTYRDDGQLVQVVSLGQGVELPSAADSRREALGSIQRRTLASIRVIRVLRRSMVPLSVATVALGVVAYVVWVLAVIVQLPSQSHWFGIVGLAGTGLIIVRFFVRGVLAREAVSEADQDRTAVSDDAVA